MHYKDLAKFLAGFFTFCFLLHIMLCVGKALPIHMFGMELTDSLNNIGTFVSAALVTVFAYIGFFKKK